MLYFDNAATTYPKPPPVQEAVLSAIRNYGGNPGRGGYKMAMRLSEKIYESRKKVADFFGAELENVVFTQSCTMSVNMAVKGLIPQGGHVICSSLEHNAVSRPLHKLFLDGKLTYSVARAGNTDAQTLSAFRELINENTKAIVCTHASNVTGKRLPIEAIGKLCYERGILLIVDAAQGAGVFPIDVKSNHIHALCVPAHKGLYGITGSGILILNGVEEMDTLIEGGTGSLSLNMVQPDFFPDRLEVGTINTAGIFSIGAGIDFINSKGMDSIYQHEYAICKRVYDFMKETEGIRLYYDSYEKGRQAPIIAFNIGEEPAEAVASMYSERNCALRGGWHCAPFSHTHYATLSQGMVRFAPSAFSKDSEVSEFIHITKDLCKKHR